MAQREERKNLEWHWRSLSMAERADWLKVFWLSMEAECARQLDGIVRLAYDNREKKTIQIETERFGRIADHPELQ